MNINYDTLTAEKLEEHVEFIDWLKVPSHLLTDEVKENFGSLSRLKVILWFENLLNSVEVLESEIYTDGIFFFIGRVWYMEYSIARKELWYSGKLIRSFFEHNYSEEEICAIIKTMFEKKFNLEVFGSQIGRDVFRDSNSLELQPKGK